jgi:hypothetical protein
VKVSVIVPVEVGVHVNVAVGVLLAVGDAGTGVEVRVLLGVADGGTGVGVRVSVGVRDGCWNIESTLKALLCPGGAIAVAPAGRKTSLETSRTNAEKPSSGNK